MDLDLLSSPCRYVLTAHVNIRNIVACVDLYHGDMGSFVDLMFRL